MNAYFVFAELIAFILGIVHSYMGEKYLVSPILRSEHLISALSGSVGLKKVALRVCWHFATIAMWGTATTLVFLSSLLFSHISLVVARIVSDERGIAPLSTILDRRGLCVTARAT